MDTHNIGGLRRIGGPFWDLPQRRRWETADIAILVFIYRQETLVAKKIGLLQSKRLYPDNNELEDDDEVSFMYGMNAFIRRDKTQAIGSLHQRFAFDDSCIYGVIQSGSDQVQSIERLNTEFGEAVYYLLYNPPTIPFRVTYPLHQRIRVDETPVGCRVLEASYIHRVLSGLRKGDAPTLATIKASSGWPLETWAADLLLTCQVGQQYDESRDRGVRYFLERRSGPIGAALAVSITLPGE